jgi:succinate dehydrogenase / fumarate reductase cytochrome b subunit
MSLFVPFFVWILYLSLHSEESFQFLTQKIAHDYCVRLVLWALSCAFLYHIYSGVRHLLMDLHYFESKEQGQSSALFVIGLFLVTGLSYTGWFWRIL